MKNFIVGATIIGVAIVIGFVMSGSGNFGASSGPDHYNMEYFHAGIVYGGDVTTLTAGTTTTMTAAQVCKSSIIQWTPAPGVASTTFPTSEAVNNYCLPNIGSTKSFIFRNTGDAASTTVMVAGTGMVLLEPDGQNVVIAGSNSVLVSMTRLSTGTALVVIDELIDAD